MARNRLLIVLLLLAHVVLDMVICRLADQQPVGSPAQIALIAMMRTQLSLLAMYLALGTASWIWRLLAMTAGVAGWTGAFLYYQYADFALAPTATLFTVLILPLVLIGVIARSKGLIWGQWSEETSAGTLAPRQFSLGAAFRWLTLSALLLGLTKMAEFPIAYRDFWFRVSLINTFLVMALLLSIATIGSKVLRLGLVLLVTLVVTLCCQDNPAHAWVTKFLLQAGLMFGTLEICAMAGWPLERSAGESHVRLKAMQARSASE